MEFDIREIEKILPQKYPFLLIDRIIAFEPKQSITSVKNVSYNEDFFSGHFPGNPVMPGALIIEAMAQTAIVYFAKSYPEKIQENLVFYLAKADAKFTHPVVPGDQLKIEIKPIKVISRMAIVEANAFVGDKEVAHAELAFAAKENTF